MHRTFWHVVLVRHKYDVCKNYAGSVYVGLSENGLCVFRELCCSVVFGTLIGVFVFSGMWSELLMTSAISCPLWSLVYECQTVECAFTSPMRIKSGLFVERCMQCCMSMSTVL